MGSFEGGFVGFVGVDNDAEVRSTVTQHAVGFSLVLGGLFPTYYPNERITLVTGVGDRLLAGVGAGC